MYKMIIVDDHTYLIEGMQRFINWNNLGIEIIDTAFDGEDGLEKIRRYHPDIVITDINMPVMDGLDMIKTLRNEGAMTKFVILTAYNQFEYAKEAMKYGVADYIVKPALPDDIVETLSKVVAMCDQEKKHQINEMRMEHQLLENRIMLINEFMQGLFEGHIYDEADIKEKAELLKLPLNSKLYRVITVHIDNYHDSIKECDENDRKFFIYSVISIICGNLGIIEDFTVINGEELHFLLSYDNDLNEEKVDKALYKNLEDIINRCKSSYGINVSIGVGCIVDSLSSINFSYKESTENMQDKADFRIKQIIFHSDRVDLHSNIFSVQHKQQKSTSRNAKVVKQILDYIEKNYNKDISLNELSKQVYFTPNYLGNIFSKQFKKNFNDYVVEYRIEKAKEIMRSESLKIYEIAEMVGYKDTDYFRRIFKEYVGVTPSEYMKNPVISVEQSGIN